MRTETRKLAGIATVVCGGVASMGAQAVESGLPAATAGPIALLDGAQLIETASRPSEILPIVDATGSDAQWSSDATANVTANISMPVFHTLPIAVPMQADTVADMKTEAVEPFVAATQADEPARKAGTPQADDAMRPAQPAYLSDAPKPMKKPPLSYAAPIAVPVHAVRPVETSTDERPGAMREQARLTKTALRAPTEPLAESSRSAKAQHVSQHVSYAAPIAIGIASRPGSSAQAKPLADAEPFADSKPLSMSSDMATPVTQAAPLAQAKPQIEKSTLDALSAPPTKTPLSYAAPVMVSSPAAASASASRQRSARVNEDPDWPPADTVAISEQRLDSMRGGFDLASGLKVSFGISRMVVVNGNLVTTTSLNIPDIGNITAQQAQALASVNAGSLIQNGPGNVVQPGALPSLSGAVIQNTLSNQNIQALTTINTTVNSLSLFKSFNVGSTLNSALTSAVRGR